LPHVAGPGARGEAVRRPLIAVLSYFIFSRWLGRDGHYPGRGRLDPKVSALVYVSAFAPEIGETGSTLIGAHPTPPALSTTTTDKAGFVRQTRDGVLKNMAPDIPITDAEVLALTQGPLAGKAFGESVTAAAWKTKPSWFTPSFRRPRPSEWTRRRRFFDRATCRYSRILRGSQR